ncbi:hypothetical protein BX600DRAFT_515071 [Xylariales sp. PMI_506]|nr:hypothetical protein BX600DRAFT_515071 [Xylariales sp. PMI_506]
MRLALLVTLPALAAANPFNVHIKLQDAIEAVFTDSDVSGVDKLNGYEGKYVPDPDSHVITTMNTAANTKQVCFWSGTAPFCEGACPRGWSTEKKDGCGDGNCCASGWKYFCCRTFDLNDCYWSGTAPFCEGGCDQWNEIENKRDNCGDGKCCSLGTKAQCCKGL